MNPQLQINIAKPCHENWQQMTTVEKGKFCASCQKKVFDFTALSDREIFHKIAGEENVCGRFLNSQLDRELIVPKEKSSIWLAAASAAIGFFTLGTPHSYAQQKESTEQFDTESRRGTLGKIQVIQPLITISGVVRNESGVLPNTHIERKGKPIAVNSDANGVFSIEAQNGDTLVFTHPDMVEKEVVVENKPNNDLTVLMRKNEMVITTLGGASVLGMPITRRRTLAGRAIYKISRIFK